MGRPPSRKLIKVRPKPRLKSSSRGFPKRAMANFSSISRNTLAERRRRLRRNRRVRALQAMWRTMAVSALAAGAIWLIKSPVWIIQSAQQIDIQGNELLSPERVRSLLPIQYPEPLWAIRPEAIAQHLEARGPIAYATVTRHLVPPSVTIEIQERRPVAIAQGFLPNAVPGSDHTDGLPETGLLDETGAWIPLADYSNLNPNLQTPNLIVIGMRESNRAQWVDFYATLARFQSASPKALPITQIDWRSPSNLILSTALGSVHLGAYQSSDRLLLQLQALNQMQTLPSDLTNQQIDFINLVQPENPFIQMR